MVSTIDLSGMFFLSFLFSFLFLFVIIGKLWNPRCLTYGTCVTPNDKLTMVLVNNNLKMMDAPHGCSRCSCCCSCSCSLPPRSGERSDAVEHVLFVLFITVDFDLTDSRSPSSPPAAMISTYKVAAAAARCLSIVAHRILYVNHTRKK